MSTCGEDKDEEETENGKTVWRRPTSGYSMSGFCTVFNSASQSYSRSLANSGAQGCPISVPRSMIIFLACPDANLKNGLNEKSAFTAPVMAFMAGVPSGTADVVVVGVVVWLRL